MLRPIQRSYMRWVANQDRLSYLPMAGIEAWISAAGTVLVVIAFGAWIPLTRNYLDLNARAALLCFLPCFFIGLLLAMRFRRDPLPTPQIWFVTLVNCILLQFFAAALVPLSRPDASPIFALLYVVAASHHGYVHRATAREPFLGIGTLLAALGASLFSDDERHYSVLAIASFGAAFTSLSLGTINFRKDLDRAEQDRMRDLMRSQVLEQEQLRAAVRAQLLRDQSRKIEALSESLVEILGRNHDLRNLALVVSSNTRVLLESLQTSPASFDNELVELIKDLHEGVDRMMQLLQRAIDRDGPPRKLINPELVHLDVIPILDTVVADVQRRFQVPQIHAEIDRRSRLPALVNGGEASLYRALSNLLVNACEGDGQRHASSVTIRARVDFSGTILQLEIIDDGPGFNPERLANPFEAFKTSKPDGTGLGLYTVERLVKASGGSMSLSNMPQGGARVRLEFPRQGAD